MDNQPNLNRDRIRLRRRSPLQAERPATEFAVLGLLFDGPSYGYDLTRSFTSDSELGKVCRLEMSMLYALLKKLEREGLITGRKEAVSEHKTRRVVEITSEGRKEFEEWLNRPVRDTREVRLAFMVKLFFARLRNPVLAMQILEDQIFSCRSLLAQLYAQQAAAVALPESHFQNWVLDFRTGQNQAVLDWLEKCRSQLVTQKR